MFSPVHDIILTPISVKTDDIRDGDKYEHQESGSYQTPNLGNLTVVLKILVIRADIQAEMALSFAKHRKYNHIDRNEIEK